MLSRLENLIQDISADAENKDITYLTPEVIAKIDNLAENYLKYYKGFREVAGEVTSDPKITPQKANELMIPHKDTIHRLETDINDIASEVTQGVNNITIEAQVNGTAAKRMMLLTIVVCVFLITGISIVVPQIILKPLKQAISRVKDISEGEGDLTKRMDLRNKDEMGELAGYLDGFI